MFICVVRDAASGFHLGEVFKMEDEVFVIPRSDVISSAGRSVQDFSFVIVAGKNAMLRLFSKPCDATRGVLRAFYFFFAENYFKLARNSLARSFVATFVGKRDLFTVLRTEEGLRLNRHHVMSSSRLNPAVIRNKRQAPTDAAASA